MTMNFDYRKYSDVFGKTSFPDRAFFDETTTFRKSLNGVLFIDRVLTALGITKANKIYPPKTDNALKALHQQVCDAPMSVHHRLSIFYYLLLDLDHGKTKLSEDFLLSSGMPEKYQIFMKGLWYLDRHQFKVGVPRKHGGWLPAAETDRAEQQQRALEYVAHPSLIPDFADEIISVLVGKAPDGDYTLALSYFHTVQPVLRSAGAMELLFAAMAHTSLTQALHYSRTFPEHTRQQLFERLVASVLDAHACDETADRAAELVSLALEPLEDGWFEEYLSTGDGTRFKKAKDTLLMRRVATGRYGDAIAERGVGTRWGPIVQGLKQGLGDRV